MKSRNLGTDLDLRQGQRMRAPTCAEIDFAGEDDRCVPRQGHSHVCFPSIYEDTLVPYELSFFYKNANNTTVTLNEDAFVRFDYLPSVLQATTFRLQIPFLYTWVWGPPADGTPHAQLRT